MKVGDCDDHSLQVADLDEAGLQDEEVGTETSLQAAAGNAPGLVVATPTTPVATNVDPFILELFRVIEAQSANSKAMMNFVHEGGFRFSRNDKKEFSDALILEPDQRALSPLFPNSWILFARLLDEYGFVCTRGSLHNAARTFTHPEFKKGGQLHLIQKKISPTTNRPAKKLKMKGKGSPLKAIDVLSKHLDTQHQITVSAQEICEQFHKLKDSTPVNVKLSEEQIAILQKHTRLLEDEISLVVNWAKICESELFSMMGFWKAGFCKQSATVLTWKHVELAVLCEAIESKVTKGDFRVSTVVIARYLMESYGKLSAESKEQAKKVEKAVQCLLKRRPAAVDAFAAGPSDAGSAKAGASNPSATATAGPGQKKSAAGVNKKSSPKIAPGASDDSSFTRAAGRGKRTASLSTSAGTGSSCTAGRGMITAPHACGPVLQINRPSRAPTTLLLRPQTGLSAPALGVKGSPPGMMQPQINRPSRAPTTLLLRPQTGLSAPALGFGGSPPGMMQPQINGPVILPRKQQVEMQGGGHGGPPPHDRQRSGVPPVMTREAPPRRGMLGPSRPRMQPRSPNQQQQKSQ